MAGILAAGFAPAAIGSGVLMPVRRLSSHLQWDTLSDFYIDIDHLFVSVRLVRWNGALFWRSGTPEEALLDKERCLSKFDVLAFDAPTNFLRRV